MSTRGLYYRACAGEQNRRGLAPRSRRRGYQLYSPAHVGQPIVLTT